MRSIGILGLIAAAVCFVTAFNGAGMASASVKKAVICKVNQKLCKAANLWGEDVTIKAESTRTELLGTLTISCKSQLTVLAEKSDQEKILGKIILVDLTNCQGCTTVTATTLPTGVVFPAGGGNGTLEATSEAVALLKGCPFGIECTAKGIPGKTTLIGGTIGGTALAEANEIAVSLSGGLCGTSGKWDAGPGASEPYIVKEVNGATTGEIYLSEESHS